MEHEEGLRKPPLSSSRHGSRTGVSHLAGEVGTQMATTMHERNRQEETHRG